MFHHCAVSKGNLFERFGQITKHFGPRRGYPNVIFNPNSPQSSDINPGLDRDHHAFFQDAFGACGNAGPFMDLQTDTMPQTVTELRSLARVSDDIPSDRVQGADFHARFDGCDGGFLGL